MKSVLVLSLLLCLCIADEVKAPDAFDLTDDNFDKTLADKKKMFVMFFAPWCGHCKRLSPAYNQLALDMKESDTLIAKIDCTANTVVCGKYKIQGYPTLKHLSGSTVKDFKGERTLEGMKNFITKVDAPAFTEVDSFEALEKLEAKNVVIGTFAKDKAEEFTKAAENFKFDIFTFVLFTGDRAPAAKKYALGDSNVVIIDEPNKVQEGKGSLDAFLKRAKIPLFGQMSQEAYSAYLATGLPLASVVIEKPSEEFTKLFETLAKKHKGLAFCFMPVSANIHQYFNLPSKNYPAFAINKMNDEVFYSYEGKFEEAELEAFLNDFEAGKLKQSIKSEPVPKNDNPEEIFEAVGTTLEEVVNDPTRDVLVKFYATWCGHCKKLEPDYKKLAKYFAKNDKVRIARINVPENTVDKKYGVRGFPTLVLFKANDKKPLHFDGERTFESLVKFVSGKEPEETKEVKEEAKEVKEEEKKKEEL